MSKFLSSAMFATKMCISQSLVKRKSSKKKERSKEKNGTKLVGEKGIKQVLVGKIPNKRNKAIVNGFQVLATEDSEPADIETAKKEDNHQENKDDESMLIETGQEESYKPTLPQQPYVEVRP